MNNKCAKCSCVEINKKYDVLVDLLRLECLECGYWWNVLPDDRKEQLGEEIRKLLGDEEKIKRLNPNEN